MSQEEAEPIDTTDAEDAEVLLADPDDYHQAQRLKQIHRARQRVHETLDEIDRYTTSSEHQRQKIALADAVTAYISELEPLMLKMDYDTSLEGGPWDDLRQYCDLLGYHAPVEADTKTEIASYHASMQIFRQANGFLSEVKPLLTEKENNEWEV